MRKHGNVSYSRARLSGPSRRDHSASSSATRCRSPWGASCRTRSSNATGSTRTTTPASNSDPSPNFAPKKWRSSTNRFSSMSTVSPWRTVTSCFSRMGRNGWGEMRILRGHRPTPLLWSSRDPLAKRRSNWSPSWWCKGKIVSEKFKLSIMIFRQFCKICLARF